MLEIGLIELAEPASDDFASVQNVMDFSILQGTISISKKAGLFLLNTRSALVHEDKKPEHLNNACLSLTIAFDLVEQIKNEEVKISAIQVAAERYNLSRDTFRAAGYNFG